MFSFFTGAYDPWRQFTDLASDLRCYSVDNRPKRNRLFIHALVILSIQTTPLQASARRKAPERQAQLSS